MNNDTKVVLSVRNISKYYGNLTAVDSLSFDVYKGEIFGFLGPNGAGKTTSISMISGLIPSDAGEIIINSQPLSQKKDANFSIGMCPQNIVIWNNLTCLEQIIFMGQMYGMASNPAKKKALELLDELGLIEKKNSLGGTLSGGMKRRLNIILALIHDPDLVILDEPEAGLDPQSRVFVRDFIKGLALKKTVILTTHDMDEAERLSDRIAIIDKGKLLVLDTPENLNKSMAGKEVVEFTVDKAPKSTFKEIENVLAAFGGHASFVQNKISIMSDSAVESIKRIIPILASYSIPYDDIKIRKKSLEDVFISLTGRGLRD